MKLISTTKSILVAVVVLLSTIVQAQVIRPFSIHYQTNQKGGIIYLANVSVSCGSAVGCSTAEGEIPPAGNGRNNDFNQQYVDVDADGTTFMSSSDSLSLPACSNITYAGLFWGGSINNATPNFANRNKVKISINNSTYQELTADSLVSNNSGSITYHCYKNITSLAQANGKFARYTIADLVTQTNANNRFGGWTIVIAYRNDLETLKNLTVFSGVANVSTTSTPVQVDISGFLTPPTGPVSLEMGVVAYDGDRGFVQDSLYFNGAGSYISVNDGLNPTRDIFNSTISNKGVQNPFRMPLLNNTLGYDADIFSPNNAAKNFIGNNATNATLRLTTGNENYYTQVVTTAIDVYEPDIRVGNTTVDLNGAPLNPGDTLEYTVTVQNLGSDSAINTQVIDTIPFNLDYVPNSIRIVAGPNQGNKTDAAGDDQGNFDAVGNRVVVRIGTGANAINGGNIADSPSGSDSTTVKFRATVTQECIRLRCSGFVNSLAAVVGTGFFSGNTQTNFSNPNIFDGGGCPIPGFTSTLINLPPSCSLPPDTALSACPPYLFTTLSNNLPGYVFYSSSFNPIAAATSSGTYFGIKTLTTGCTDTIGINITIFPLPAFTSATPTNPTCGFPTSGSFVLNGLNPNDSIAFSVGTVHNNASPFVLVSSLVPPNTYQNLTAGNYTIRLKNATSCTRDQTITLAAAANCAPSAGNDNFSTNEDTPLNANVSGNDVDLNLDPLTFTVLSNPTHGIISMNAAGAFTYTPNLNYNGPDSLTYTVCDNGIPSLCDTGLVIITVIPVNDAPVAVDDLETINEDNALSSTVATNDADLEGNTLEFGVLSNPSSGILTFNTDGSYTYTPNANFNGSDSFTYTVCDDGSPSLCDTGLVSITINAVNDAPIAVNDTLFGGFNLPVLGNASLNDLDVDGNPLNFTLVTNPTNGNVVFNADGTFTYLPNLGFVGNDFFTYAVCDNGIPALCDTALVFIGVNTTNLAPVALDDNGIITNEDTPITGDVSTNDFDPNGDLLSFSLLTNASNGNVVVNSNGTFTYTPVLNFNGNDAFTYLVCDNGAPSLCDTATVNLTINPVNDAPRAVDDQFFGGFNLAISGNVSTNDFDVDGDPLVFTLIQLPDSGTVIFNVDGTFTYTPNFNFVGNDTLVYTVCDNGTPSLCDTAIVVLGVNTINLAPLAVNDNFITNEDTPLTADVSINDSDPNANTLAFSLAIPPQHAISLFLNPDGTFTYIPSANYFGPDSFTYITCDNGSPSLCDSATVFITILPINDAPIAINDTNSIVIPFTLNGTVATNDSDVDGDTLTFSVLVNGSLGTLVMNPNGSYAYTPGTNPGIDTITYVVCDNGNPVLCDTAQLFITVNQLILPPTAVDDNFSTNEDTPLNADVSSNDLTNGNTVSYSLLNNAIHGTVQLNLNGTFTYTPNANYNGADSFTYLICDGGLPPACDTGIVNLTVVPVNDAPLAVDDANSTTSPNPVSGSVAPNDSDIDGDPLTFSVLQLPLHGTVVFNSNGTYTYTPAAGFSGLDSLSYIVCDNSALCDTAVLVITIAPSACSSYIATHDIVSTNEDNALAISVLANDTVIVFNVAVGISVFPLNGTVVVNANNSITYTPNLNFNGTDSFIYTVGSSTAPGICDTALVSITINAVNDAPIAVDDNYTTPFNSILNDNVSPNDFDVDGNTLTFSTLSLPANGTLLFNSNGTFSFTPALGFTGSTSFTYLVCDNGIPSLCDTGLVTINVSPDVPLPLIGIAKSVNTPVLQSNGSFLITYTFVIKNYGNAPANSVQVTDDLGAAFPLPATVTVSTISGSGLSVNPNYNGTSNQNLLEALTNTIGVGVSDTITLSVFVTPNGSLGPFNNSAIATALASVPDSSVNGNNPDPDGNGVPDESSVTPVSFPFKTQIGLSKTATATNASDGTFDVTYTFSVQNMGTFPLNGIDIIDNLQVTFPSPLTFTITSITADGGLTTSTVFTGIGSNTNLLNPQASTIAPGVTNTVVLKLNVNTHGTSGTFNNTADAHGTGPGGSFTKDVSNNGHIDNNNNGNPGDPGEDTQTPITLNGEVVVTPTELFIPQGFTPDGDAQNEFFVIRGISNYPDNQVTIYNRWGNIIYQMKGYDNSWNGISDKGDGKVTQGTYYYVLELNKDDEAARKGYIVIEY